MLVHGVPIPSDQRLRRWRYIQKQVTGPVATTVSALATAITTVLGTGIAIAIPPQGALHIVKYEAFIQDNGSTGKLSPISAQFGVAQPGAVLANIRHGYPLMEAVTGVGPLLTPNAYVGAVVDDWLESDDCGDINPLGPVTILSAWSVNNSDGAAHNVLLNERLTAEVWQLIS